MDSMFFLLVLPIPLPALPDQLGSRDLTSPSVRLMLFSDHTSNTVWSWELRKTMIGSQFQMCTVYACYSLFYLV